MNHCPKCKTSRRPGLKHCHGCQFEFDNVLFGNEKMFGSFPDAALGFALLIASTSAILNLTFCGIELLNGITGSKSLRFEDAMSSLGLAFASYVVAVVLWRVLNLPKSVGQLSGKSEAGDVYDHRPT